MSFNPGIEMPANRGGLTGISDLLDRTGAARLSFLGLSGLVGHLEVILHAEDAGYAVGA